ncbi:TrbI F-type domain-containing protein [uncultured Legionella sp.]|uniref:TrbI F-type domain-containing protein n=1 Tax=uncultured Legionella sp. TaxID=210934 RepID=UPI002614F3F9|nr:TrbI F-type domain-containing protein [uncultured Legionella sp.]
MNKVLSTVLSVVIPLLILQEIHFWLMKPKHIGTVDIVAITTEFVRNEAKNNHSKQEKAAAIKSFSHRLEASLNKLSQSDSLILLPKEAVIKGGTDYTQTVISMIQKEPES